MKPRRTVLEYDGRGRACCILSESLFVRRVSRAMIGVSRQDRCSPIELLQKHHTNHLMRPGRGPEGDRDLCLAAQIRRKSVRDADNENSVGDALVPPLAEPAGKRGAVDVLAALVETHKHGVFRDCGRYRGTFFGDSRGRVARAAFGNLMNVEAAKAELAAGIVEAPGIALGQLALGPL